MFLHLRLAKTEQIGGRYAGGTSVQIDMNFFNVLAFDNITLKSRVARIVLMKQLFHVKN